MSSGATNRSGFVDEDRKSTRLNSSHVAMSYAVISLNATATPELDSLSLHDALPIYGQVREVAVRDEGAENVVVKKPRAAPGDSTHVGAPMPGTVLKVHKAVGDVVGRNEPLGVF